MKYTNSDKLSAISEKKGVSSVVDIWAERVNSVLVFTLYLIQQSCPYRETRLCFYIEFYLRVCCQSSILIVLFRGICARPHRSASICCNLIIPIFRFDSVFYQIIIVTVLSSTFLFNTERRNWPKFHYSRFTSPNKPLNFLSFLAWGFNRRVLYQNDQSFISFLVNKQAIKKAATAHKMLCLL